MIYNVSLNDHRKVCNFCTIYIVLLIITFIIFMDICSVYIYFYLHTRKYCFNKLPYQCKEYGRINTSKGIDVNKTNA